MGFREGAHPHSPFFSGSQKTYCGCYNVMYNVIFVITLSNNVITKNNILSPLETMNFTPLHKIVKEGREFIFRYFTLKK